MNETQTVMYCTVCCVEVCPECDGCFCGENLGECSRVAEHLHTVD
ncbi:hypothetical protein [Streptomyces koyangensis]